MDTKIVNIDKYRKCLSMVMLMCIKEDTWAKFVAKLNNTEAGMKKSVAYKKGVPSNYIHRYCVYYTVHFTLWNSADIVEAELHAVQHLPYYSIIPFSYDSVKTCFQNSDCITENLLRRMKLFELLLLESGDLHLKACAFKFLIVLLLCYTIVLLELQLCSYFIAKLSSIIFWNISI